MMGSFADGNGFILDQYTNSSGDSTPTFFLAYDDATASEYINQPVYIDNISFEKYAGYENFDELYWYDDTNKKALSLGIRETVAINGNALASPIEFIIKAKAGGKEIAASEMNPRYVTWATGVTTTFYNSDGTALSKKSGYNMTNNQGVYKVKLTAVDTSKTGYNMFCFTYEDAQSGKKYIGYRMLSFNYPTQDANA